jgi:adenylate kinase family enzyme
MAVMLRSIEAADTRETTGCATCFRCGFSPKKPAVSRSAQVLQAEPIGEEREHPGYGTEDGARQHDYPRLEVTSPQQVRRISVVGNTGSGKTNIARLLAGTLGIPHFELDAFRHQPGWQERSDDEFLADVERMASGSAWVIDGNYQQFVQEGPVWARADTVVWMDVPRPVVMRQLVWRTVRRVMTREELWNGNREPLENLWSRDPYRSVIAWAWTRHTVYADRYAAAMVDPQWSHLQFVRLGSRKEADRWVASLATPEPD